MSVIGSDSLKMTAPICQSVTHLKVICTARQKNPRIPIFTENYLYQLHTDNSTEILKNWPNNTWPKIQYLNKTKIREKYVDFFEMIVKILAGNLLTIKILLGRKDGFHFIQRWQCVGRCS